jgi:hypothetical protein
MNFKIFSLFGEVLLKDEAAQKGLDNIDKKGEGIGKRLGGMAKTAAKWGAGLAAGAGVAVGGMLALVNKTSAAADEIDKMSIRTQLSRTQLQELRFATGQVGVEFSAIEGAVSKMTRTMSDAEMGTVRAQEAFAKLGVSTTNADGSMRSADVVFQETLASLSGMSNETERNALAMEVFGRGANELTPLLDAGTEGIAALSQQAHDLGSVLSDEAIAANVKFADTMDAVKTAGSAVVAQVGNALLPIVQNLLDWVLEHMPQIKAVTETVFNGIGTAISFTVEWIRKIIDWFKNMSSDGESRFSELFSVVKEYLGLIIEAVQAYIALFMDFWNKYGENITSILKAAFDLIMTILKVSFDIFMDILRIFIALFKGDWKGLWEAVQGLLKTVVNGIIEIVKAALKLVIEQAKFYLAILKNTFGGIFTSIKETILGVFDTVVSKVQSAIQRIKDLIESVLGTYQRAKDKVDSFVSGAKDKISNVTSGIGGFFSSAIPGLAEGGKVMQGGRVLVGEVGPEILDLPKGARVTPLDKTGNGNVTIQINNPTIMNDDDADRLGDLIVGRLRNLGVVPS